MLAWYRFQLATADAGIAEIGSVFYCVRQKNIDGYEVRRQLDRLEMSGAGDGYGHWAKCTSNICSSGAVRFLGDSTRKAAVDVFA
jgi:hypothetical protein